MIQRDSEVERSKSAEEIFVNSGVENFRNGLFAATIDLCISNGTSFLPIWLHTVSCSKNVLDGLKGRLRAFFWHSLPEAKWPSPTVPLLMQRAIRSSLVCLQARSVRCEPDEVDEQKARRRIRRYVENFLRVQRSLAMQIALRSVKILMNSLVVFH